MMSYCIAGTSCFFSNRSSGIVPQWWGLATVLAFPNPYTAKLNDGKFPIKLVDNFGLHKKIF